MITLDRLLSLLVDTVELHDLIAESEQVRIKFYQCEV